MWAAGAGNLKFGQNYCTDARPALRLWAKLELVVLFAVSVLLMTQDATASSDRSVNRTAIKTVQLVGWLLEGNSDAYDSIQILKFTRWENGRGFALFAVDDRKLLSISLQIAADHLKPSSQQVDRS